MRWIRQLREDLKGWLGPTQRGILDSLASIVAVTISFRLMTLWLSPADLSAGLFWSLAEIGAALFIAYSIALVGVGPRIGAPEHRNWLASGCTLGVLGLSAIGLSLGLASLHETGRSASTEVLGLCWIAANLVLLGAFIALLPAIAASWRDPAEDPSASGGDAE